MNNAGAALSALRKTEQKTCPECRETRIALVRAMDTCIKCRDRLRKRKAKDVIDH